MNEADRERYQQLRREKRRKNRDILRGGEWTRDILLQECFEALGTEKVILPYDKEEEIISIVNIKISKLFGLNVAGKELESIEEINIEWIGEKVYIIWDRMGVPVIQTSLNNIKKNIDDVLAVAFDTWIVSENINRFIEFNHNGKIIERTVED